MIAVRLLIISMLALMISSCASRQVQTLANLPLPADQSGTCCWQALQQLDISYKDQQYKLTGALAQTHTGVTLVLLDPFGRRLLSINKHGDTIDSYRSPELPAGLPERFLLASSLLVWWPLADWETLLSSDKSWQIITDGRARILSHRGKPVIRALYAPNSMTITTGINLPDIPEPVVLQHEYQNMSIRVTTQRLDTVQEQAQ